MITSVITGPLFVVLLADGVVGVAAFSIRGRPALSPARLALVSILQFGEGLSDRQTAEAVRARIDWKYALGSELTDAGFGYSVLSEFRDRLIAGSLEQSLLDTILERAVTAGPLRAGGLQRTDSTHVLLAMRTMNRLEQVHETVRAALNALAAAAPDWLPAQAEPGWSKRYEARVEGTIAQGVKGFGLRRSRYRGTAKTHLQHLLTAAAMNLTSLDAWLTGTPLAPTRTSHFAALRPVA